MPFSATLATFHMNSIDTPHKGESRSQGFSDVKRAWSYGWRAMILGACSGSVGLVFVHQFGCFCSFQVLSIATIKKPAKLDGLNCSSQNLLHHIPLVLVYRANLRIFLLLEWLPMGDQCNWVSPIRHHLYAVNYPQFHSCWYFEQPFISRSGVSSGLATTLTLIGRNDPKALIYMILFSWYFSLLSSLRRLKLRRAGLSFSGPTS